MQWFRGSGFRSEGPRAKRVSGNWATPLGQTLNESLYRLRLVLPSVSVKKVCEPKNLQQPVICKPLSSLLSTLVDWLREVLTKRDQLLQSGNRSIVVAACGNILSILFLLKSYCMPVQV